MALVPTTSQKGGSSDNWGTQVNSSPPVFLYMGVTQEGKVKGIRENHFCRKLFQKVFYYKATRVGGGECALFARSLLPGALHTQGMLSKHQLDPRVQYHFLAVNLGAELLNQLSH